jgi:hypothetical protein
MMTKRIFTIFSLFFLLCSCSMLNDLKGNQPGAGSQGSPSASEAPTPVLPPTLSGDLGVQQLMLDSSSRWKTLQASYTLTAYPQGGGDAQPDITVHEVWIQLPTLFKVVIKSPKEGPVVTRISNGKYILDQSGTKEEIPPSVLEPFTPPTGLSDTVTPHPLAGLLGTPVSDLIFPVGLAQRGGEYHVTGEEIVAGRDAIVADWSRQSGVLIDRLWVDKKTGVVLRQQNFGKGGTGALVNDYQATYISFDGEIDQVTFGLGQVPTPTPTEVPPTPVDSTARVTILPKNLNVRSGPNTSYDIIATLDTGTVLKVIGRTGNNEWYKVEFDGKTGWVLALYVEFSGDADKVPVVNY